MYPFPTVPAYPGPPVIQSGLSGQEQKDGANNAFESQRLAINTLATDLALVNMTYLGAGRFVGSDIAAGAPVAGTGLTIRLPNQQVLVQGRVLTIDDEDGYIVIDGVPASAAVGAELFASLSSTDELEILPENIYAAVPTSGADLDAVKGLLHLGRVTTGASSILTFTASTVDRMGVIRPPSTPGGGDGDVTTAQLDATVADLRAQILALSAEIATLQTAGAPDIEEVENESSIVSTTLMRLESFTVALHPDYALATSTTLDQPRYAGYGQLLDSGDVSPNIDGGGNAVVDFELNSIHG